MPKRRPVLTAALFLIVHLTSASAQKAAPARPAGHGNWIPTWATAQQLVHFLEPAPATPPPPPVSPAWTTPPSGAAPLPVLGTVSNQTIRMIARTSIGGRRVRVKLANAFNGTRVEIGAAHIAIRDMVTKDSGIVAASDRKLTFGGLDSIKIAPGAIAVSDPVDLAVKPLTDLAVSLYFPGDTGKPTTHARGLRTTYVSKPGNFAGSATIPEPSATLSYYWLAAIEVDAPANTPLIVAFGDSITDGSRSTPDTHNTWPAILATRLAANKATAHMAIVNQGIGGNRVLSDGSLFQGVNALARLDRDVLNQPGVKWLMVLEGINDIGNATARTGNAPTLTAADLIVAYRQIIDRARSHGIKVIGCTLTPYEGANYFREEGEAIRQEVNTWIRTSGAYDAVVDFDAAVRDPANPRRMKPEFDPGDHLHPNDAGYRAMAEAVELSVFVGSGLKAQGSGGSKTPEAIQGLPLTIEDVRIVVPMREGLPPDVEITVRNTGTRVIEAWGVTGEVRYTNGATRRIGVGTDTYETTSLPESMRPPAATSKRLPPGGQATITTSTSTVALATPIDATAFPTYVVFEDDTAVGDEQMIEFVFSRRRLARRVWRLASEAWTTAAERNLNPDESARSIIAALEDAGEEVAQSVPLSIVKRTLSSYDRGKLQRLRVEIESRLAAAERHAERRR
jgi:lysophospholipase L1-like esterase